MVQHVLSFRTIVLSWTIALALWPLTWAMAVTFQGLGTVFVGGHWIGAALPLGEAPWALVNEPGIAFAASRDALVAYWLPPIAVPAVLVLFLPVLAPTGGSWVGELALFHIVAALAVLDLGWAVPLGRGDGPAAGLARFWGVDPVTSGRVAGLVGAIGAALAVVRLSGYLWHLPGGPTRFRRLVVSSVNLVVPLVAWLAATALLGWQLRLPSVMGAAAVAVGGLVAAVLFVPRTAIVRPSPVNRSALVVSGACGLGVALASAWLGAAGDEGRPRAVLWAEQTATSNVRQEMQVFRLTPLPDPTTPRAPSAAGS